MKKRSMGDAAEALFKPSTGAAALAAISSEVAPAPPPTPLPLLKEEAPKEEEAPVKFAVTTFRVKPEQWEALRMAAIEQAKVKGGKADASEVLRGILDNWMANRKKT